MAVVVGRMVAILEAQTAQFDARMSAAAQQMDRWGNATSTATRGMQLMRSGFQQLAFQATGVAGPVGKLATAIGMIGVGGPVTVGVLAGIAVISLAYQGLTRDAREQAKAQEDLIKALQGVGVHAQLTAAKINLSRLQTRQETGQTAGGVLSQFLSDVSGGMFGVSGPEQNQQVLRDIAAAVNAIGIAESAVARWQKQVADDAEREAAARARTLSLLRVVPEFPSLALGESLFARDQARLRAQAGGDIAGREAERLRGDYFRFHAKEPPARAGFKLTPEFAIMSSMALLQGAQGGAAGLFGAAAGPLAMINPLAGAITAGIGGIFSLFDSAEEKRHRKLVETIQHLGEEVGLERVTVIFTGPDGHQVRRSLAELEESDAVERVPGPVGVGG